MNRICLKVVLRAQFVLLASLAGAALLYFLCVVAAAFVAKSHGAPFDRAWWMGAAVAVPYLALFVTGHRVAATAPRAPMLHAVLCVLPAILVMLLDAAVESSGPQAMILALLSLGGLVPAVLGAVLRIELVRRNIVIRWGVLARGALAVAAGLVVAIGLFLAAALLLEPKSLLPLPVIAVGAGMLTAWLAAPRDRRALVASIFFALVTIATVASMAAAMLDHSVRAIHWYLLLSVGVAWFMNRKLLQPVPLPA